MQQCYFHRVFQLLCLIFLAGCASSTVINTEPQGAQVFVDGELKGSTPYTYSDRKTIGSTTNITVKKEGYEDFTALIVRNEEFDPGACAGGIFTLIPFLWVQKYSPSRTFELTSLNEGEEIIDDAADEQAVTATPAPAPTPAAKVPKSNAKKKAKPVKKKTATKN
jgi:hypothetical protein